MKKLKIISFVLLAALMIILQADQTYGYTIFSR